MQGLSDAQTRVFSKLRALGCEKCVSRVTVTDADLASVDPEALGLELFKKFQLDGTTSLTVVNCSASLKMNFEGQAHYAVKRTQQINERTNVGGLKHLLAALEHVSELSGKQVSVDHFVHFSTAYVHGTARGCLSEAAIPADVTANNVYETTKREAESEVARWHQSRFSRTRLTIIRPSIVTGPETRDGLGAFLDLLTTEVGVSGVKPWLRRALGLSHPRYALLQLFLRVAARFHLPIFMRGNSSAILDLIDVEDVSRLSLAVIKDTRRAQEFPDPLFLHLTNPESRELRCFCQSLFGVFGFEKLGERIRFIQAAWIWKTALRLVSCIPAVGAQIGNAMETARMLEPYLCRTTGTVFDVSSTRYYFEQLGENFAPRDVDSAYLEALLERRARKSLQSAPVSTDSVEPLSEFG